MRVSLSRLNKDLCVNSLAVLAAAAKDRQMASCVHVLLNDSGLLHVTE